MSTLKIADFLKYADLQLGSEAFLTDENTDVLAGKGKPLADALFFGNGRNSRFAAMDAKRFSEIWEAVAQKKTLKLDSLELFLNV